MRLMVVLVVFLTVSGCSKNAPPATGDSGAQHAAGPAPTAQPQRPLAPEQWITSGGGSLAAGCWFTSSNGYLKDNADGSPSVGVFFGTVTPPDRPTEILYLVLYKHAPRKSSSRGVGNHLNTISSGHVEIIDGLTVDGVAAKLSAQLDADPRTGKLTRQEYKLNEQKIDMSRGRLFLVDLTVNPAKWQQVNVELPRGLPREIDRETVRRVAEDDVPALRKKHREVDDFFK
jgi:hypothetical protein